MGCIGCLGKTTGCMFFLLFVALLPAVMWSANMNRTMLYADSGIEKIANDAFYEQVTAFILPAFAQEPESQEITVGELRFSAIVKNLNREDWQAIARDVIPGDYLRQQTESNVSLLFGYLRGERARLEIEFDTATLRENLLGQPGSTMVNRIFNSWDTCTPEGEAQLADFLNDPMVSFPYCKPTDTDLQRRVFTSLNNSKDTLAAQIPDTWNAREQYAQENNVSLAEADQFFYESLQRPTVLASELMPLNFLFLAGLLAFMVIFAVDSPKSFFRWMGAALLIGSLFALLPLGTVPLIVGATFNNAQNDLSNIETGALRGLVSAIVREFTMPILIQGTLIMALGFLSVFLSLLVGGRGEPDTFSYFPTVDGSTASQGTITPVLPGMDTEKTITDKTGG